MVSEKDVIEAFNKGKRSGAASAARKAKDSKPRRRRRVYRVKRPDVQLKQAVGKFQHKHPYVSGLASGVVLLGPAAGIVQASRTVDAFDKLRPVKKVPVLGTVYDVLASGTYNLIRRYWR